MGCNRSLQAPVIGVLAQSMIRVRSKFSCLARSCRAASLALIHAASRQVFYPIRRRGGVCRATENEWRGKRGNVRATTWTFPASPSSHVRASRCGHGRARRPIDARLLISHHRWDPCGIKLGLASSASTRRDRSVTSAIADRLAIYHLSRNGQATMHNAIVDLVVTVLIHIVGATTEPRCVEGRLGIGSCEIRWSASSGSPYWHPKSFT